MKKILPLILIVLGICGGGAAGLFLKPPPEMHESEASSPRSHGDESAAADTAAHADGGHGEAEEQGERSYVKVGKQTVIPVIQGGETRALMLFELAVDVTAGANDRAAELEPRLRDAFLRELFKMSYTGAFMTSFTDDKVIEELRRNLVRAARRYLGDDLKDVLILDVMRQEL